MVGKLFQSEGSSGIAWFKVSHGLDATLVDR